MLTADRTQRRGTRFGGKPFLPAGTPWPTLNGEPLAFVGQYDLAALARDGEGVGGIAGPPGVLGVFVSGDPTAENASVVLTFAADSAPAAPVDPPDPGLVKRPFSLVPTAAIETEGAPQESERATPRHKLGGFADWIQGDGRMHVYFSSDLPLSEPEAVEALRGGSIDPASLRGPTDYLQAVRDLEARGVDPLVLGKAGDDFELLAQIDSDERADLCWGDVGRVYLFARTSDVHARRFDRVVLTGECY